MNNENALRIKLSGTISKTLDEALAHFKKHHDNKSLEAYPEYEIAFRILEAAEENKNKLKTESIRSLCAAAAILILKDKTIKGIQQYETQEIQQEF